MKKVNSIMWGTVLLAAGILFALNALEITNINLFFNGWWTLFIILPCGIGIITSKDKIGNLIGLTIGVLLLLCCLDILSFSVLWKLLIPVIIAIIGLKMIFNGFFGNRTNEILAKMKENGKEPQVSFAAFSGYNLNYASEVFDGAELNAIFGGIKCDLRGAVIEKDCAIKLSAIFGGIDILVPENVNVKVYSNCIFGGISDKTNHAEDSPTIYINGTCIFGGVEIK